MARTAANKAEAAVAQLLAALPVLLDGLGPLRNLDADHRLAQERE
jgi:hypothetical protein